MDRKETEELIEKMHVDQLRASWKYIIDNSDMVLGVTAIISSAAIRRAIEYGLGNRRSSVSYD